MLLALMLFAAPADAARLAQGMMAVLELQSRVAKADELDRLYLSDRIRRAALRQVPGLRLMTRDNMEVIAKANGIDLANCEAECELVTGQKLGADLLVTGDLSKFGSLYKLSLRLHEVATARLLSVGQASGRTPEELDKDLDQAMRELLAPFRGVPIAQDALAERPYLPWGFLRDRAKVVGGGVGNRVGFGLRAGVRVFGVEGGLMSLALNGETNRGFGSVSRPADIASDGKYVGLSPFSYGTDRDGPSAWTFTWLQPFLLYTWGSSTDTATDGSGATQTYSWGGPVFGNRFSLSRKLAESFEIRLEAELGASSVSFENDMRTSKVDPWISAGLALAFGLAE